jgi:hypothetical protein
MFIISLLATPSLVLIEYGIENQSCSTSCCTPNSQEQSNDSDEDGCNDVCNPFLSCGSCIGFIAPSPTIHKQLLVFIKQSNNISQESPSVQFTHAIWHPPKFG